MQLKGLFDILHRPAGLQILRRFRTPSPKNPADCRALNRCLVKRCTPMAVDFRILGDVEAHLDGQRLDIGHARQRGVLIGLLVDVNHPVSADQLIDRVWTDAPPHNARNALAAYISRLRQILAIADTVQIVRGPGGYTLNADAQLIDMHRFRQLAARARAVANPADAVDLFKDALELWRGDPFTMFDTPWANELRRSLEAEHFSVRLDRNDAALAVGGHAQLVGDLTATLQSRPLDERVAGQLMLAMYRSGRQADATQIYRSMRDRLVDDLGLDPGPALQSVYQSIVEGGSTPLIPQPDPVPRMVSRESGEVPRRPTKLIGREGDVSRVIAALGEGPVVTLTGVGGVGKTRLALEAARREQKNFTDGAWLCELAPVEASAVSHAMAATLRLHHPTGRARGGSGRNLRPLELLLVVDNCEHVLPEAARLSTDRPHCSRVRSWQPAGKPSASRASGCFRCCRFQRLKRLSCLWSGQRRAVRTSTSTVSRSGRWPKYVDALTAYHSRSSWPPRGCER